MAEDYGIKIAKQGFDVKTFLTELNKKNFNILSTEGCLLRKELSASKSTANMFFGYKLAESDTEAHPLNYGGGTAVHVIYENLMP